MSAAWILIVFMFGAEPRVLGMPDKETCDIVAETVRSAGDERRPHTAACMAVRRTA
jgi:hypothetical protein